MTYLGVVSCIDDIRLESLLGGRLGIDDTELELLIDDEVTVARAGVHLVILPHRIDEEGLHRLLLFHLDGVDGIHQVGVVEHDLGRLLGEILSDGIDEIQQAGIGQILDIVHHGGATGLDILSQLAHVGRL